jgi:hypothetical protein
VPSAGLQFEERPSPTCIKPLCVGPVIACPVFDPGEAEFAAIGVISASDPTKANPRMRNLVSCHKAAFDTQPHNGSAATFRPAGRDCRCEIGKDGMAVEHVGDV